MPQTVRRAGEYRNKRSVFSAGAAYCAVKIGNRFIRSKIKSACVLHMLS